MSKKRNLSGRSSRLLKDLHLDKPTSHGGWGKDSGNGSWNDDTPVNIQISDWLLSMGLADDKNSLARLSENKLRAQVRIIVESSTRNNSDQIRSALEEVGLDIDKGDVNRFLAAIAGTVISSNLRGVVGLGYALDAALFAKSLSDLYRAYSKAREFDVMMYNLTGEKFVFTMNDKLTQSIALNLYKLNRQGEGKQKLIDLKMSALDIVKDYVTGFNTLLASFPKEFGFAPSIAALNLSRMSTREALKKMKDHQAIFLKTIPFIKKMADTNKISKIIEFVTGNFDDKMLQVVDSIRLFKDELGNFKVEVSVGQYISDDFLKDRQQELMQKVDADEEDDFDESIFSDETMIFTKASPKGPEVGDPDLDTQQKKSRSIRRRDVKLTRDSKKRKKKSTDDLINQIKRGSPVPEDETSALAKPIRKTSRPKPDPQTRMFARDLPKANRTIQDIEEEEVTAMFARDLPKPSRTVQDIEQEETQEFPFSYQQYLKESDIRNLVKFLLKHKEYSYEE